MNQKLPLEIWTLFEAACNEIATAEQRERLRTLVKDDPDVRRLYFEYVDIHLGCAEIVAARSAPALPAHLLPRPRRRLMPFTVVAACAAAAVALIVVRSGSERPITATNADQPPLEPSGAPPTFVASGSERSERSVPSAPAKRQAAGPLRLVGSSEEATVGEVAGSTKVTPGQEGLSEIPRTDGLVAILRRAPRSLVTSLRIDHPERRLAKAACAAEQPSGLMNLFSGSALGSRERVSEGLRVLEDTMPNAKGQWVVGNDACSARWLAWAGLALEAVAGSPYAAELDDRVQRIARTIDPAVARVRLRTGAANGIRPIESALAFTVAAKRTNDDALAKEGVAELKRALLAQRPDGRLSDRSACEAHQHAEDVVLAHALLAHQPDDEVERAVRGAGEWLVRFMQPGSTGLPDKTGPDACEYQAPRRQLLQWALVMHGIRFDPGALELAQQARAPLSR